MYPGVGPYENTNEIITELEHCLNGGHDRLCVV